MINLASWYYRNLLNDNLLIEAPEFFEVKLLNNVEQFEAVVSLKNNLRPSWVANSEIYKNCDGSGTALFKNIAVYKAISEALERLTFYELADLSAKEFCFDVNPTTTGMAAYPHFNPAKARVNAKAEAIERWAIHEFNKSNLPIKSHISCIKNFNHYEIITPFNDVKVSLLAFFNGRFYIYGFAGGKNLRHSFDRALIELDRNLRVLTKSYQKTTTYDEFKSATDRTIFYFSTQEGYFNFKNKIDSSPNSIININPKILCDKEMKGKWNTYTKVWRYLLDESYFDYKNDHTFFMF